MRTKGQLLVKIDSKKLYYVLIWQDVVFQEEGWDPFPLLGTSRVVKKRFLGGVVFFFYKTFYVYGIFILKIISKYLPVG